MKKDEIINYFQNILRFCDSMDDIYPDFEFDVGGNDIYYSNVRLILKKMLKEIKLINDGKTPFYTQERLAEILKETKRAVSDE